MATARFLTRSAVIGAALAMGGCELFVVPFIMACGASQEKWPKQAAPTRPLSFVTSSGRSYELQAFGVDAGRRTCRMSVSLAVSTENGIDPPRYVKVLSKPGPEKNSWVEDRVEISPETLEIMRRVEEYAAPICPKPAFSVSIGAKQRPAVGYLWARFERGPDQNWAVETSRKMCWA